MCANVASLLYVCLPLQDWRRYVAVPVCTLLDLCAGGRRKLRTVGRWCMFYVLICVVWWFMFMISPALWADYGYAITADITNV